MSVFLGTQRSIADLALDLQRIFGVTLWRIEERDMFRYEHRGLGYRMTLLTDHGLEDDMGIPFSKYKHQIDFDSLGPGAVPEYSEQLKRYVALYAYSMIIADLKCPAMVVYNLQEKIAVHGEGLG
ncbi:hypothetical protein [Cystobacter fuscus]|nr:hypothetical protein [Cystobacter fuscus]